MDECFFANGKSAVTMTATEGDEINEYVDQCYVCIMRPKIK